MSLKTDEFTSLPPLLYISKVTLYFKGITTTIVYISIFRNCQKNHIKISLVELISPPMTMFQGVPFRACREVAFSLQKFS